MEILGISFDSPEENKAFADAQSFPYRLLSDADHRVGEQYGAKRDPDEKFASLARRISFLIDPERRIRKTYVVTDPAGHAGDVLDDLSTMR